MPREGALPLEEAGAHAGKRLQQGGEAEVERADADAGEIEWLAHSPACRAARWRGLSSGGPTTGSGRDRALGIADLEARTVDAHARQGRGEQLEGAEALLQLRMARLVRAQRAAENGPEAKLGHHPVEPGREEAQHRHEQRRLDVVDDHPGRFLRQRRRHVLRQTGALEGSFGEVEIALKVLECDRDRAALRDDQGDVLAVRDGRHAVACQQVVERHRDDLEQALEPGLRREAALVDQGLRDEAPAGGTVMQGREHQCALARAKLRVDALAPDDAERLVVLVGRIGDALEQARRTVRPRHLGQQPHLAVGEHQVGREQRTQPGAKARPGRDVAAGNAADAGRVQDRERELEVVVDASIGVAQRAQRGLRAKPVAEHAERDDLAIRQLARIPVRDHVFPLPGMQRQEPMFGRTDAAGAHLPIEACPLARIERAREQRLATDAVGRCPGETVSGAREPEQAGRTAELGRKRPQVLEAPADPPLAGDRLGMPLEPGVQVDLRQRQERGGIGIPVNLEQADVGNQGLRKLTQIDRKVRRPQADLCARLAREAQRVVGRAAAVAIDPPQAAGIDDRHVPDAAPGAPGVAHTAREPKLEAILWSARIEREGVLPGELGDHLGEQAPTGAPPQHAIGHGRRGGAAHRRTRAKNAARSQCMSAARLCGKSNSLTLR